MLLLNTATAAAALLVESLECGGALLLARHFDAILDRVHQFARLFGIVHGLTPQARQPRCIRGRAAAARWFAHHTADGDLEFQVVDQFGAYVRVRRGCAAAARACAC